MLNFLTFISFAFNQLSCSIVTSNGGLVRLHYLYSYWFYNDGSKLEENQDVFRFLFRSFQLSGQLDRDACPHLTVHFICNNHAARVWYAYEAVKICHACPFGMIFGSCEYKQMFLSNVCWSKLTPRSAHQNLSNKKLSLDSRHCHWGGSSARGVSSLWVCLFDVFKIIWRLLCCLFFLSGREKEGSTEPALDPPQLSALPLILKFLFFLTLGDSFLMTFHS